MFSFLCKLGWKILGRSKHCKPRVVRVRIASKQRNSMQIDDGTVYLPLQQLGSNQPSRPLMILFYFDTPPIFPLEMQETWRVFWLLARTIAIRRLKSLEHLSNLEIIPLTIFCGIEFPSSFRLRYNRFPAKQIETLSLPSISAVRKKEQKRVNPGDTCSRITTVWVGGMTCSLCAERINFIDEATKSGAGWKREHS